MRSEVSVLMILSSAFAGDAGRVTAQQRTFLRASGDRVLRQDGLMLRGIQGRCGTEKR